VNRARRVVWLRKVVLGAVAAASWLPGVCLPQAPPGTGQPTSAATHAPRIGLVLSGGGARGAAHIGVLKVLDELHVPIDAIAGTSVGAVVGGLYASGLSPAEIEAVMTSVNWQEAFRDRPPRDALSFRRKEEDRDFLVKFSLGIRGGKLQLPKGLIEGQTLTMMLRRLTLPVSRIEEFENLPTPFRALATDLATGEPVVMRAGDLTTAMRASMSAPGLLSPVEREGRLLVDGGIAENLPIDVAREMNVDVLIVVDVGAPLVVRQRLGGAAAISNQMLAILIRRESQRELATLSSRDLVVTPDLGDASSFDFGIVKRAISAGEQAARADAGRLRELATTPEAYAQYIAKRADARSPAPRVDFVEVSPDSKRYASALNSVFEPVIGQQADAPAVGHAVTDLYGRGSLELLDYRVLQRGEQFGLDLTARRNSYGPNYVRFGLSLQDDFQGNAVYNAAARFVLSELTKQGGEWVWDIQAGVSPHVYTEFFLPFTNSWTWFLLPHAQYSATNVPLINQASESPGSGSAAPCVACTPIAEYRVSGFDYGLDLGRQLSNWGEVRVGILRDQGTSNLRIGSPPDTSAATAPNTRFDDQGYFARFAYDRLDDVNFPHTGQLASVQWTGEKSRLGSEAPLDQLTGNWLLARSFGRETAVLWATAGVSMNQTGPLDVHNQFTLGGLFNLSGLPAQSLAGANFAIARVLFYRKIGRGGEGFFDFPAYLGASLEAGNVWQNRGDISWGSARKDGSIFVGFDTIVGPLYLATGFDQSGKEAFYLLLGHTF
jgi:NTE family protein